MSLQEKRPALVLIDLQQGFEDIAYWGGARNNPQAETICEQILIKWRELGLPIFHVRHASTNPRSPLNPDHSGFQFIEATAPLADETVITKNVNSAFIGTDLKEQLDSKALDTLVIIGLTTDHCVSTSSRMAGNFGFNVYLIEDAVATFDKIGVHGEHYAAQLLHSTALASLNNEFAQVISSSQLFELLEK
ncbi:cysteine hydrolase family protein [Conservatibacter flavescens]|uniref:Cysteine hydrolase n=1 Tax=Conservatibacter flavescens TaxID=28161 RepID=A0A2M8S5R4_9PAST|nr:cysteine hydrolase family protein [Conservatibacter flavescens]PJG86448.1 cysteine hydrolase [Conservatibacter flavescens]